MTVLMSDLFTKVSLHQMEQLHLSSNFQGSFKRPKIIILFAMSRDPQAHSLCPQIFKEPKQSQFRPLNSDFGLAKKPQHGIVKSQTIRTGSAIKALVEQHPK